MSSTRLERLFLGNSEMAGRMRALDWSATRLGPVEAWSGDTHAAVRLCLTSGSAVGLFLGPELTMLYNDAYIPLLGNHKHPSVLGKSGREGCSEIWETVGPMLASVYATGLATRTSDSQFFFRRLLPREEVYVGFTYGPIVGADGVSVVGIFSPCTETTEQVVGARRLETLRRLGIRSAETRTVEGACRAAIAVLGENPRDIPFAALYIVDPKGNRATLGAKVVSGAEHQLPDSVSVGDGDARSPWPLASVMRIGQAVQCADLVATGIRISGAEWPEPTERALLLPVEATKERLAAILVVGVSPRRPFDAAYRTFLDRVAGHIAKGISDVGAYEAERQRAEQLAELDRGKTAFFANISHEFRTPLTLILAPLEEALAAPGGRERDAPMGALEIAHRNAARLLKLVNALLDFSRIEEKRVQARYEPTDLALLTGELASMFRSAMESAGLRYTVRCEPIGQPVYIDQDMWEKIVLNLLSNAFKFTFEGGVEVVLAEAGDHIELAVKDTGTGISQEELPRLFERFYRVEGARARTHEGSGIGLALVQSLVHLHRGEIRVESELGKGSTFIVSIPMGLDHLPQDRIAAPTARPPTSATATAFVEEATRWLPGAPERRPEEPMPSGRILVADDSADMRDYLARLLRRNWLVETVADGKAALEAARRSQFDLVLADIMMPRLDGIGMLRAMRSDPALESIPIILLSARAGEESRIAGLRIGADDYLIKPFSAEEVLARIELHVKKARVEADLRESLSRQRALMKEVHHRVKNNLEVVNSLLMLQSDFAGDARVTTVLVETANRVRVIADVHRLLYAAPNLDEVNLAAFVERLADSLFAFYSGASARVRLELKTEPVSMDIQRAVPIGLILNELFSNALKHAFPGSRQGTIRVCVDRTGFEFSDDGIGLPPSLDLKESPSLGLQLVHILVEQVGGTLSIQSGRGTRIRVAFSAERGAGTGVASPAR
jgi:signal transduction histidine kinase